MTGFTSWLAPLRRSLAGHLSRLRHNLDALAVQLREAVARNVGRAVADAVSEAVSAALEPSDRDSTYLQGRSPPLWDDPDGRSWRDRYDDVHYRDRVRDPYDDDPYRSDDDYPDRTEEESPAEPRERPWRRALSAGCRAAAWWLDRQRGKFSVWVAAGVGVAAGLAALVSGPTLLGATGVAASALTLLALADAVRCGAGMLAGRPPA